MPGKLAALIRTKYPGQYDDMDDDSLESAILAKYPDYADLVEETPELTNSPKDVTKFVNSTIASAEDYEPTLHSSLEKGNLGSFLSKQAGRF